MNIEDLAITYNTYRDRLKWDSEKQYDKLSLLNSLFVDLLHLVKGKHIKIECGVAMMQILICDTKYNPHTKRIEIGTCEIIPELNFDLGKMELSYNGVILYKEDYTSGIYEHTNN